MNLTARKFRKSLTGAEQRLWRHIRKRQLMGFKFRRQAPIGKYSVDFVCFKQRLVIELDGDQHAVNQNYDHYRTEWIRSPPILTFPHAGGRKDNVPFVSSVYIDQLCKGGPGGFHVTALKSPFVKGGLKIQRTFKKPATKPGGETPKSSAYENSI